MPDIRKSIWESMGDLQSENYGAISQLHTLQNTASGGKNDSELLNPSTTHWSSICSPEAFGASKVASMVYGVAFHYLLEGMTLGLQTNLNSALPLFVAILIHGGFVAFAISITLG